jgi:hypothetical protein
MKYPAILIVLLFSLSSRAQPCTNDDRFTEVNYFLDTQIDSLLNLEYARANDFQDSLNVLLLDIYMPRLSEDSLTKRPFVLQMFGGGFVVGNKDLMRPDCIELARKGFVCASINYRLGDVAGGRAIYRAQQDAHAAMRWIVANADEFGIDTNWLFAGGQSAGAITAGYLHYASQDDWNMAVPSIEDSLGSLVTSGNDLSDTFSLKGIIINWGAVRTDDITPSEMIPMIAFHGDEDPIVPIDSNALGAGGSRWLHNALVANNVCSDLTVAPGAGHSPPILISPSFRMSKASCLFKSLFCNDCNSVYVEENVPANCSMTTSSNATKSTSSVQVFPNPFHDEIYINGLLGNEIFTLYNSIGHDVFRGKHLSDSDLTQLPAGVYFLRIERGERKSQTFKLIKR